MSSASRLFILLINAGPAPLRVVWRTGAVWQGRRRTRMILRRLDPHLLRDIGLTEAEAQAEATRPFWVD